MTSDIDALELDAEQLDDALRLLDPGLLAARAVRRRRRVEAEIRRIVARFRADAEVDARRLPSRRGRRAALRGIADRLARAYDGLARLPAPDRVRLGLPADPETAAVFDRLARAGLSVERVLTAVAGAATAAAAEVPGEAGGPARELARRYLAERCLELFLDFRDGPLSGDAAGGYFDFLHGVHALTGDEEADLERPAKAALRALRAGIGAFGARVQDKT